MIISFPSICWIISERTATASGSHGATCHSHWPPFWLCPPNAPAPQARRTAEWQHPLLAGRRTVLLTARAKKKKTALTGFSLCSLHTGLHRRQRGVLQPPSCLSPQGQKTLETFALSESHPRAPTPQRLTRPKRTKRSRSSVLLSLGLSRWVRTSLWMNRHQQHQLRPTVRSHPSNHFQSHSHAAQVISRFL